ncbi:hypothetical protein [Altericroceibacterium xinjiangense]|uniref:hypothetical protein n=1 Tax=Altericroceibacterium xinjiangense TaxID=762261 RepID=UPI000F7EE984|nr:hypothetical protein [Altericroceibacterium xinjiangense]
MTQIVTAVFFSLILAGIALRANARLRHEKRLPMQWWLTGDVTWSAPRLIGLAFIPVLAFLTFAILIILSFNVQPRPGQEGVVLPAFIGLGITFVAIQVLHLWLAQKTLRRNGS